MFRICCRILYVWSFSEFIIHKLTLISAICHSRVNLFFFSFFITFFGWCGCAIHWCGGPWTAQGGIQALETMLFTLDEVNPVLQSSVGFTLGTHILDDCDKDTYGLEQAVAFIKGSLFRNNHPCPINTSMLPIMVAELGEAGGLEHPLRSMSPRWEIRSWYVFF